jgi:DNA-binding NarL/FixJ family response regulator
MRGEVCRFLKEQADIQLISETFSRQQVSSMAQALLANVLLMHNSLSNDIDLVAHVHERVPDIKVLASGQPCSDEFIFRAVQYGLRGIIPRQSPPSVYVKAIRALRAGELWLGRQRLARLIGAMAFRVRDPARLQFPRAWSALTNREQEIIWWVSLGMTNKEIAQELGISDKTIKVHLCHIFQKLRIHRRQQLVLSLYHDFHARDGYLRPTPRKGKN